MKKSTLDRLQSWYAAHSDPAEGWERLRIQNLDNPGWVFSVELYGTGLEHVDFQQVEESYESDGAWLSCSKYGPGSWQRQGRPGSEFLCNGGPLALERMVEIFVDWAESRSEPPECDGSGEPEVA